jgi:hypothetical protein
MAAQSIVVGPMLVDSVAVDPLVADSMVAGMAAGMAAATAKLNPGTVTECAWLIPTIGAASD